MLIYHVSYTIYRMTYTYIPYLRGGRSGACFIMHISWPFDPEALSKGESIRIQGVGDLSMSPFKEVDKDHIRKT